MSLKTVTVRHQPLNPEDDECIDAFEEALDKGFGEWVKQNKSILEEGARKFRETLLRLLHRKAESLITFEALAKIHDPAKGTEGRELIEDICHNFSAFLRAQLVFMSGLPLRGRRRQFSDRNRSIGRMRRKGLSYGKIGDEFGMKRNAGQAACRSDRKRRDFLCRHYIELKDVFAIGGINLKEVLGPI